MHCVIHFLQYQKIISQLNLTDIEFQFHTVETTKCISLCLTICVAVWHKYTLEYLNLYAAFSFYVSEFVIIQNGCCNNNKIGIKKKENKNEFKKSKKRTRPPGDILCKTLCYKSEKHFMSYMNSNTALHNCPRAPSCLLVCRCYLSIAMVVAGRDKLMMSFKKTSQQHWLQQLQQLQLQLQNATGCVC